eukprot:m.244962 g.244962  ORF g.244962 m.244962 type:complete len:60 (+) comp33833_c11_seq28:2138-2317(+)
MNTVNMTAPLMSVMQMQMLMCNPHSKQIFYMNTALSFPQNTSKRKQTNKHGQTPYCFLV